MSGRVRLKRTVRLERLTFTPQRMVSWFSPGELIAAGREAVISAQFGKFADKREIQDWTQPVFRHDLQDELWIDFASDTADGFNPTATIAYLLARPALNVARVTETLPRGDVLIFGGDQVYPSAGRDAYEDRFVGPYTGALPRVEPESAAPWMYALPGNHDWYDGLTSFLRLFCQRRWIGGWRTRQRRSYFALRLPQNWWLWALDLQLDTEIDSLQLGYFRRVARSMAQGDRLLLVTAKPSWVTTKETPDSWRNLAFVERHLVPEGVTLAATLTGDIHHYSDYALKDADGVPDSVPRHRITAGGAGAYLSCTHTLQKEIELAREPWVGTAEQPRDVYECTATYPTRKRSKRLSWGALLGNLRTPSFAGLLAVVYGLLAAGALSALAEREGGLAAGLDGADWPHFVAYSVGVGSVLVTLLLVAALIAYADFKKRRLAKCAVGLLHAVPHVALALTAAWLATRPWAADTPRVCLWLAGLASAVAAGWVLGSLFFGLYVFAVHRIRGRNAPNHTNEAFAGQAIQDYKCFLRIHVCRDGKVVIYPIGVERACRRWTVADSPEGPRLEPADGVPRAHLIAGQITLR